MKSFNYCTFIVFAYILNMNLRDLEYIVAVADTRHFGKAAERCFVSQPTLSGQIKKLEEQLGVTLFERTKRSVKTTATGEKILVLAREILEKSETLKELASAERDPFATPIRIGAILTLSPYLMPLVMKPLRQAYPKMQLILSEEMTDSLISRLQRHEIDAALLATTVDATEFNSISLFDEPFWFACPRDHPLAHQDLISRKDLHASGLLLLAEGHCLADQVMELCNLNKRRREDEMADLRASSLETLLQMVSAGIGCTLAPALSIKKAWMDDSDLALKPLDKQSAFRRISLVSRKTFPRCQALEAFAKVIMENLPTSVRSLDS